MKNMKEWVNCYFWFVLILCAMRSFQEEEFLPNYLRIREDGSLFYQLMEKLNG